MCSRRNGSFWRRLLCNAVMVGALFGRWSRRCLVPGAVSISSRPLVWQAVNMLFGALVKVLSCVLGAFWRGGDCWRDLLGRQHAKQTLRAPDQQQHRTCARTASLNKHPSSHRNTLSTPSTSTSSRNSTHNSTFASSAVNHHNILTKQHLDQHPDNHR